MSDQQQTTEPWTDEYTTQWTARGHRLHVVATNEEGKAPLILTCQARAMAVQRGEHFPVTRGRIVLLDWLTQGDNEGFAAHAFGYYADPELADAAIAAVRNVVAKLSETPPRTMPNASHPDMN